MTFSYKDKFFKIHVVLKKKICEKRMVVMITFFKKFSI
jgi:hypothetical protein